VEVNQHLEGKTRREEKDDIFHLNNGIYESITQVRIFLRDYNLFYARDMARGKKYDKTEHACVINQSTASELNAAVYSIRTLQHFKSHRYPYHGNQSLNQLSYMMVTLPDPDIEIVYDRACGDCF
jgi:hypothetical protein